MRKLVLVFSLALAVAVPASAQRINLDMPGLAGLAERADEVVDVTLDASMIRLAAKFLGGDDPEEREIRDMINGLQGIYVRSYEFSKDGEYDRALIDRVKAQLGPSWKPLVTVRSKTKENVNIMADMRGERVAGLVIIAAEPREFTLVNIVGDIDIDRLSKLEGEFGIPRITKEGKDE
ncbi:MAG TPA: DUF4252 domain-containing protein [Thermoanaerobaculia bacterium]|nr:DUF4252 domain-containing protein [Thermoanaerobaculia bacterium]